MDFQKIALYFALIFVGFLLYNKWHEDYSTVPTVDAHSIQSLPAQHLNDVPRLSKTNVPSTVQEAIPQKAPKQGKQGQIISVKTDTLNITIDTLGGKIIGASFPQYATKVTNAKKIKLFDMTLFTMHFPSYSDEPLTLLNNKPETKYIAQSGLTGKLGPDTADSFALFKTEKTQYKLQSGQDTIKVDLHWKDKRGLSVTKTYTFTKGSYEVLLDYTINNQSAKAWKGNLYALINRKDVPQPSAGIMHFSTFMGVAISSPEKRYQKISFSDISKQTLAINVKGGWVSMLQHYFVSAWIPNASEQYHFYTEDRQGGMYNVGMVGPQLIVSPGETITKNLKFYAGPIIADHLEKVAPHLNLTVDYGWLWILSSPIFWIMQHIFNVLGNWGFSIILVTLFIKLIFYPLSSMSYKSMAAMRTLQPRLQALKEKHGDDKQKISQATMELYKKEKVNPFSGCLPVLIQIPFFIALYYVLMESIELRQAPFILWITDLSTRDPYFVLPVLMGLSMFLQQKLSPAPPDPTQAKVMMFLPVIFTGMFLFFPSGLVLYWLVNNVLSVTQQWYITRKYAVAPKKLPHKKND